jgi:hypothetical protein
MNTAPMPATALQCAWDHLRRRAGRTALFILTMCVGIALLLTAIDGGGFPIKLVYSLCIGACCVAATEMLRLSLAASRDWRARRRGAVAAATDRPVGWGASIAAALAAAVVGPMLGMTLGDRLTGRQSPSLLSLGTTSTRVTFVLTLLGTAAAVFALGTLERLARARAQAEAAQRLAAENQLRLLQSQLEPHMLFNTLANLRVLIGLDAARAQAMLDRLIAFLRATLSASRLPRHALRAEFEHLDDYLALMAVRMGPRLRTALDLPAELHGTPVPPLLLQPLVENAIKHGLEPQVEGGRIEVGAQRDGAVLRLTVRDTGAGLRQGGGTPGSAGTGFGLAQVRERLATLYGGRARLRLEDAPDADGGVLATIELPLETAA